MNTLTESDVLRIAAKDLLEDYEDYCILCTFSRAIETKNKARSKCECCSIYKYTGRNCLWWEDEIAYFAYWYEDDTGEWFDWEDTAAVQALMLLWLADYLEEND